MKQEDKELLLKDLCARLPYGVVVKDRNGVHILTSGNTEFIDLFNGKCNIKPYLFPLSSMTEEQKKEESSFDPFVTDEVKTLGDWAVHLVDFYNKHHFDYHGLIEKGLAIDATGLKHLLVMKEKSKYGTASYPLEPKSNANCLTRETIEGLVEEDVDLIPKFGEFSDNEPLDIPTMTTEFVKEHGLPCPNGYIFKDENGNIINTTKIVLEKKKKEYPKTYEECLMVLGYDDRETYCICHTGANERLFDSLYRLKVCRDAYWKIAGEEMGLGKPWEPDWSFYEPKFCLGTDKDKVKEECVTTGNRILAFPTEEMRDAFYENFKELIEQCKELL